MECRVVKLFFAQTKPYDLTVSFHEDPEIEKFYLYDNGLGKQSKIIRRIFALVKKSHIKLYTGYDDVGNEFYIKNGYHKIKRGHKTPTLEEYISRRKKSKRVLTLEIPGLMPIKRKIDLGKKILAIILEEMK